ncbi:MAG: YdcH family protein [Acidobacteria bacterium]|nr:YdcH family protein [Acidobacteriota bacterium]MCW5967068.1 YdcH family protein [Blastocatellales bacterium]
MSIPTSEAALKDYLMDHDEQFRELAVEHRRFESRLNELAALHYPNEDERLEETVIKKKKLALKDQMEAIVSRYRTSAAAH